MAEPLVGTIIQREKRYDVEYDLDYRMQAHLAKLKVGTRVRTIHRKFFKENTPAQKAYLFGVVIPLITALLQYKRHRRDHVYETLKRDYLTSTDENGRSYTVQLRADSDDPADTAMVAWFIEQIKDLAADEYGYPIPDADKNYVKGEVEEMVIEIERG